MAYSAHYRPFDDETHDRLKRWLIASAIIHIVIFSFLFVKETFFPSKTIPYTPTLRVDMVGLPDMLKKDLDKIPPKGSNKQEKAKNKTKTVEHEKPAPNEMVFKSKTKKEMEDADEAAQEKREQKMKSALQRIKALQKIGDSTKDNVIVKGNVVSPGTQVTGEAKEAAEASYLDLIREKLKSNWALPVWLANKNLSARVWVVIDGLGHIRSIRFEKQSGNSSFDNAVQKAIKDTDPYPLPPSEISRDVKSRGILLGFPL